MKYLISGIFVLLIAVLIIFLKKKDGQIKLLKEQLKEAQNRDRAVQLKTSETEILCHREAFGRPETAGGYRPCFV